MSNFFPSLVDDIGSLYSNISQKDLELLNEDSDYYDQEVAEFVEDIISTISISMICERYSADAVLSFFANSTEEVILEKYFSVDKVYITESIVSDEYIQEQYEILDEGLGAALRVLGTGLKMGGKGLLQGAGTALKGAGRTVVTAAKRGMGPGGRKALGAAATKVKEIGTAAKAALTSPMAKNILKGAGIVGLGGLSGFVGAKLAGAGSDYKAKVGPKIVGPKIVGPKIVGPKSSSPSGGSGSTPSVKAAPTKPAFTAQTGDKAKDMATWAKANPRLAEVERLRAQQKSAGKSVFDKEFRTNVVNPVMYNSGGRSVEDSKKKFPASSTPAPKPVSLSVVPYKEPEEKKQLVKDSYEYDAYDLVLEYLLSQGHTDTVEEAQYVMMEMDAEMIGTIVEGMGLSVGISKIAGQLNANPRTSAEEGAKNFQKNVTDPIGFGVKDAIRAVVQPADNSPEAQKARKDKYRP